MSCRAALPVGERIDLAMLGGEDHDCPAFRAK